MNGFRQAPAPSRKDQMRSLQTELSNAQMALQMNQMMTRQLMENTKRMSEDMGRALGLINELQYKILAFQKASNLDVSQLKVIADELRLQDFNEASDKADKEEGLTAGGAVTKDSTVILTSKTEEEDRGIFRSRIKLAECGVPELIEAFMGREEGAKAIVMLNGIQHEVELLGVRQPTVVETAPVAQEASNEAQA